MIEYRYPGGDWIAIDGDSYTVGHLPGKCATRYTIEFTADTFYSKLNGSLEFYDSFVVPQTYFTNTPSRIQGLRNPDNLLEEWRYFRTNNQDTEYIFEFYYYWILESGFTGKGSIPTSGQRRPRSGRSWIGIVEGSVKDLKIIRTDGLPDNCGSCVFEVFKAGELILKETNSVCPEVKESGVCPEDTCEVECGDTICCYNSDGISVLNFPK